MTQKKKPMHENGFLPKRKEILGNAKANLYFPVDTRHDTDLLESMLYLDKIKVILDIPISTHPKLVLKHSLAKMATYNL